MVDRKNLLHLLLFITLLCQHVNQSRAGWWFSSSSEESNTNPSGSSLPRIVGAEFGLSALESSENAINLVEAAKLQMRTASQSCWLDAYSNLFAGCSKILTDQDLKDRLSWDLSDCFQKHSGRASFPYCNPKHPTKSCLKNLDGDEHKVYLQYFLKIDTICHQLQIHAFKHQTERLVNDLTRSAQYTEEKLETIEQRGEKLLINSKQIHGTLESIDHQTQKVAETSKSVQENVFVLRSYSQEVYEQSKGIAASQIELIEGQKAMKERIDEGLKTIHDSHENLGIEIDNIKDETVKIEKEIERVGETMFSKMGTLQSKADDIEVITGNSLDKQKQLLDGQSDALEGLHVLTNFQSEAIEESRRTLQRLSEFGKKQQEELLQRQEQLQQAHQHLADNSKSILEAQEAFESKQARMLSALDKLFALHNALLIESRSIKVFIIYSLLIFVLYMFTSMKQTHNVRPRLYLGLCVAFFIELSILRCTTCDLKRQAWIVSSTRTLFLLLASAQLMYAVWTYRDYEVLNHEILLTLIDKVNGMQRTNKNLQWDMDEDSSDLNWCSWINTELPDDVDKSEDPDYVLAEEIADNLLEVSSSTTTNRYNLRNRRG